jgi:5-methylcytosine-specific restriction protein B
MLHSVLTENCYPDLELKTLTIDVGYYISHSYQQKWVNPSEWFPSDYSPEISVETWLELLTDKSVFTQSSLEIMKRMKDYGGSATCSQLATKYGETANFYNAGSSALAKRVADKTNCPVMTGDTDNTKWWPILYFGKKAHKEDQGTYIWKQRDELREALDKTDLSGVALYVEPITSTNYWWLNANPRLWSFTEIGVGETHSYTLHNENGNKRRIFQNFLDARAGDLVIGYESNPVKKVVALARIVQENDGKSLTFEKTENLSSPIDYLTLKNSPELAHMEYFENPQGSLFKLTKGEFDFIMDIVREDNPVIHNGILEPYSKDDFLAEVYMTGEKFDSLIALLSNKQNIILQGAPGVGKTFTAKRLAYAVMEEKDDSRIELIQFHQNYSYEDFIMGYKPSGEGFELQNGIFYRFCQKAVNMPDKSFFFIIDEINRGNLSKIFGEILMLIENNYRGTKVTLAYNGMPFSIPKNLYLIGMMNTADRSLALIDYALRRRFSFFEMEPGFTSEGFRAYQNNLDDDTLNALIDRIQELNKEIIEDSSLGNGFCIGHSYFCGKETCSEEWMREVIEYDIIPMLKEYWFDEPSKLQRWENLLYGIFND